MNAEITDYQRFISLSRYARWLPEQRRRETWEETCQRFVENIVKPKASRMAQRIYSAVVGMEVMPSMRAVMTAGAAADRDNTCIYNCSYLPCDDPKSFDEAMFILLCGTGVGFSVERQYVSKLPEVPHNMRDVDSVIHVEDSKEGWAYAYRELLAALWAGAVPKWDVSKVRPAGAKLNTFGGRASGPGPLVDLFQFSIATFRKAQGRKLTSIECHDIMCKIGEIVVVGGVRRSAMISLSNLSDDRMRHAKSGQWWENNPQRALANNSVAFTDKPDSESFMREWLSLMESKSGERGIFNRTAAKKQAAKNGRRDADWDFGTNPCCVSGETLILTSDGYMPIQEAVGRDLEIWNGESFEPVVPYEAGEGDLVRVTLTDGSHLDCTWNHRWVVGGAFKTTDALHVGDALDKFEMPVVEGGVDPEGDAYSQGFYSGDGNKGYTRSFVYEPKYPCIDRLCGPVYADNAGQNRRVWNHGPMLDKSYVPVEASLEYRLEWLAGILDSDGVVTRDKNGSGFQIVSIESGFLDNLRLMLTTMGVRAKVVHAADGGYKPLPDGRGGSKDYYCQPTRRILIGNSDAYHLMQLGLKLSRLDHNGQAPQRDARRFVRVASIEPLDRFEMTYCFSEPKTSRGTFNGIVTGNSEIILRPYAFCNLSEVVARADDTLETLKEKVEIAAIIGTIQSTYTHFPYLRPIWQENTEAERLLGVSLTGIMDCPLLNNVNSAETLEYLRQVVVDTNKEWAEKLGVAQSTATTAVKPSGTVSQLVDSASGIHARHSEYYIRTVRGDNKDPLTQLMKDQGIPHEPCVMKPDSTTVFSFPQKAPASAVTRNDMSALEQLELWLVYQRHWCEHKPSVTVSVRDEEWLDVGAWVFRHFDEVSGISFLPYSDHTYQQAPYQDCTKEQYEAMLALMPAEMDWSKLGDYEVEDTTKGSQTLACASGVCELVDLTA